MIQLFQSLTRRIYAAEQGTFILYASALLIFLEKELKYDCIVHIMQLQHIYCDILGRQFPG
jgi:hypothetical protein